MDLVLDAYEAADRDESIAGQRWTIEHAFIGRADHLPRLKKLDVAISAQDHLYLAGPSLVKYWGRERAFLTTPVRMYLDAGLLVSAGTDAAVVPYPPLWTIYHFVTRDTLSGGVMGAEQRITREEAIRLSTINNARLMFDEARKGSIETGKLADLIVLSDDILSAPAERIRDANVTDDRGRRKGGIRTMKRRTLLQLLGSLAAALSRPGRLFAQAAPLGPSDEARVRAIAEVVLPDEIGAAGRDAAVKSFLGWVSDYRADAETDHGYGFTRLRRTGPSPAAHYAEQLNALDDEARKRGRSFVDLPVADRQSVLEAAITAAKVERLPATAGRRPHRHRSHGVVLPEHRSERPLLSLADRPRHVPCARRIQRAAGAAPDGRPVMPTFECDVCIVGGGISAALLSQKVSELRPGASIIVVEAGDRLFDLKKRMLDRQRSMAYGENPWPGDYVEDQSAQGVISRTMAVGGSALHWGGVTNRFSQEDLRLKSMYGLAADWPIEWAELERYYCEAERRIGVSAENGPFPEDKPSQPYPMPVMPLSWNLLQLKAWAEKSGVPFGPTPQAKNTVPYDGRSECKRCNTCEICPTGARYSPDETFRRLLAAKKIQLHDRTLVRRLVTAEGGGSTPAIVSAEARHRDRPDEPVEYRARTFVVAAGYCWSPHLLLASRSSRFPAGLANRTGNVGRYMAGHAFIQAQIELDAEIYPGINDQHSLQSRQFFRCATDKPFVRHDFRIWESASGRDPRLKGADGKIQFGNALLADWRARAKRGAARVRMYYDVHPSADSTLTLDPEAKNRYGDPLPKIVHRLDAATEARLPETKRHLTSLFAQLAKEHNGKILATSEGNYLDHPAGGCRMGTDPATSVCDSFGRTHDHRNLFVVGSPDAANGRLHERHADLRGAHAAVGQRGREIDLIRCAQVRRVLERNDRQEVE